MDKTAEATLKRIYDSLVDKQEISVEAPEYDKGEIDMLVSYGFVEKLDASTLSGWSYILRPTYAGKNYFIEKKKAEKAKRRHIAIEVIKFLIPTVISIIALIVSILK